MRAEDAAPKKAFKPALLPPPSADDGPPPPPFDAVPDLPQRPKVGKMGGKRRTSLIAVMRGAGSGAAEGGRDGAAEGGSAKPMRKRRSSIIGFMQSIAKGRPSMTEGSGGPAAGPSTMSTEEGDAAASGSSKSARKRRMSLVDMVSSFKAEVKERAAEVEADASGARVAGSAAADIGAAGATSPSASPTNRRRRNSLVNAAAFIHKHHKKTVKRMKSIVKTTVDDDDDDDDEEEVLETGTIKVAGDIAPHVRGASSKGDDSSAPDLNGAALQALLSPLKSADAAELADLASANVAWEEANNEIQEQLEELEEANREGEDHAATLEGEAEAAEQAFAAERGELLAKLDSAALHAVKLEERLEEAVEESKASAIAAASNDGEAQLVLRLEAKVRAASVTLEKKEKEVLDMKAAHKVKLRAQVSQVKKLQRKMEASDARAKEVATDAAASKKKIAALEKSLKAEKTRAFDLEEAAKRSAVEMAELEEKLKTAVPVAPTAGVDVEAGADEAAGSADEDAAFAVTSGVATIVGRYSEDDDEGDKHNQDSFVCVDAFDDRQAQWLFGVFDGHGSNGHDVSQWVRDAMPADLLANASLRSNPSAALFECHAKMQKRLTGALGSKKCSLSGTTSTVVLVRGEKMICASVGDSCAYLGRVKRVGGEVQIEAIMLSIDHKPDEYVSAPHPRDRARSHYAHTLLPPLFALSPVELKRIEAAGGQVRQKNDYYSGEPEGPMRIWAGASDQWPGLAMSRSIGDSVAHNHGAISEPDIVRALCIILRRSPASLSSPHHPLSPLLFAPRIAVRARPEGGGRVHCRRIGRDLGCARPRPGARYSV